jgi:putative ribosome biogenesis GTPase RsgA
LGLSSNIVSKFQTNIEKSSISIYDFGSQLSERKKLTKYNDVTDILFFISAIDYLIINKISKFQESIEYLLTFLEDSKYSNIRIFILFTKVDILEKNLKNKIGLYELSQIGFDGKFFN